MRIAIAALIFVICAHTVCAAPPESQDGWKVQTEDTVVLFAKPDAMPLISEIRSPGSEWNYVTPTPEAGLPELVSVAGAEPIKVEWTYKAASAKDNSVTFRYTCASPQMTAVSTWKGTALPGPVEHELVITNEKDGVISLVPQPATKLHFRIEPGHTMESWWVEKGAGNTTDVGIHIDPVKPDTNISLHSGSNSHNGERRDAIPWFALHDAKANRCIYGGIEFSGWVQIGLRCLDDNAVAASMGTSWYANTVRLRIAPGETCELPPCLIGVANGSVDDACNRLHRWVEKHLRPAMPGGVTPLLVNNSWGSGMAVDDKLARTMIDECAGLGMEVYHVDAGWFKAVGDYFADPVKFPKGLESVADYAHSKGLKFGLWTAWTQGGSLKDYRPETLSPFNPAQRDWFGFDYAPDWKNAIFAGATVCLACPDARDWCMNDLRRCVKSYKLDLLEHDQHMINDQCTRTSHGHTPADQVDTTRVAAYNYYKVYEQLLKEYPNLILEDCLNGGRLVDFGVAKRTHYICATDNYQPLSLRRGFHDTSYPMPPSMVEAYIGNHTGSTLANFKYMLRSGMMGWCTVMLDTSSWNPEQRQAAKRCFQVYKERLRPLIAAANLYHVLPRATRNGWDGIQYFDPKTGKGVLYAFRTDTPEATRAVQLRGLNPAKSYKLTCEDGSVTMNQASGQELMGKGLSVTLSEIHSSDLVFIEEGK